MNRIGIAWKNPDLKEYVVYGSTHTKFKNRQNSQWDISENSDYLPMGLGVQTGKKQEGISWGAGNFLYLDLCGDDTSEYICNNSLSYALSFCAFGVCVLSLYKSFYSQETVG